MRILQPPHGSGRRNDRRHAHRPHLRTQGGVAGAGAQEGGALRLAKPSIGARSADPQTLDLFAEVEHA